MKSVLRPGYAEVKPLVEEYQVYRPWLHVTFLCPVTGFRTRAKAEVQGDEGGRAKDFWSGLKSAAQTAVSVLIVGMTGDLKGKFGPEDGRHDYSAAQIEQAIVDAFLTVRGCFRHNGEAWVSKEKPPVLTELELQIKNYPIKGDRERDLLTRCLMGLAALDGKTCEAERKFLSRFAPAFDRLEGTMPSMDELSAIREEARPTVYLLALTLAMVDQDFSSEERAYMADLANGLGLSIDRASALRRAGAHFLVQQSLRQNSEPSEQDIADLSKLTEISIEEINQAAERYRESQA